MARHVAKPHIPKYREKNGYGHCRIKGQDYYFGRYQPPPPAAYWDLIARYKSGQPIRPAVTQHRPSMPRRPTPRCHRRRPGRRTKRPPQRAG